MVIKNICSIKSLNSASMGSIEFEKGKSLKAGPDSEIIRERLKRGP